MPLTDLDAACFKSHSHLLLDVLGVINIFAAAAPAASVPLLFPHLVVLCCAAGGGGGAGSVVSVVSVVAVVVAIVFAGVVAVVLVVGSVGALGVAGGIVDVGVR